MTKAQAKLARSIETLDYASTEALETERRRQLAAGRNQSLKLLNAIEAVLKSRQNNGGRRATIEDMLG